MKKMRPFWCKIQCNGNGKGTVKDDSMIFRLAGLKTMASQTAVERFGKEER